MHPAVQPTGIDHQIPVVPNDLERIMANGILKTHNESVVISIGINVAPAPRVTPFTTNIVVNIM